MFWRVDPELAAAEKLPDWPRFHRACGEQRLFFDRIERDGKRGPYQCVAFTTEPTSCGGWRALHKATGKGATVLDALAAALAGSGHAIPEAEALLLRGLNGDPEEIIALSTPLTAPEETDDFDALLSDDFDALL